ncbi:predicted protein [Nematostella vectensis]|uniref:Xyloside xylosyltransferase 1 n=1 Tax=Nematostella vectensis TaxID=45351 RepID=A7SFL0_NEMVE|nr:predicted protein [Nematostella vectensis]|eukprot:XP_001629549.1 predicted protein [Nematostella vectensis]
MTQFKPKSDYFRIGEYNILMTLVKAYHGSPLAVSTEKCIKSICKHSIIPITFHFIVDKKGTDVVKGIFMRTSGHCTNPDIVFHDADKLAERLKGIVQVLQRPFSYKKGAYYSDPIFFLSTALHKVFPENLTKIIMLDSDLRFRNDINLLFQHFKKFESSNIMGLATEQQPVYRHIFDTYRHNNPGTMVGEPPPNGITGFNSGVALLHLENMRRSKTYNQIISSEAAIDMAKKYNFKGHLGDQDFYSLLSVEHKDLFYILPCGWNRQLCSYWRDNGYAKVFDLYFNCSMPVHVYHGNCRTAIPED